MINWRIMLYAVAKVFRKSAKPTNDQNSPVCGVIDDTLLEITGRHIEGISKVFDHITQRCVLGYRCLVYSYWDGASLTPLDFTLHAEKGQNKKRLDKNYDDYSLDDMYNSVTALAAELIYSNLKQFFQPNQ